MKFIKKTVLLALIVVLSIWIIQLLICDFLTFKYSSCIDLYQTSETLSYWIDDSFSAKIISRKQTEMKIYYYNDHMGILVVFDYCAGEWISTYSQPDIIWSSTGNADRIVWPYWYHCFYFLS